MVERRSVSRVAPDAMALRALAHPQRLRMLGLLRIEGPATATSMAARLGLNSGATSYHLRQLARHGFVAEDETRGNARDRWWKAVHEMTTFGSAGADDEATDAGMAFAEAALHAQIGQMQRAMGRHAGLTPEWRRASTASDFNIPLTAAEAEALVEKLHAVLWESMENAPKLGGHYPDGVEVMTIMLHGFPHAVEEDTP